MPDVIAKPHAGALAPRSIYDVLGELARDPTVPLERITGLYQLTREAEKDEAKRQFDEAFNRLRMPRITKQGTIEMGAKGSMKFARYEDLDQAIRPIYTAEGFSLSFISEPSDKGIILVAVLARNGHEKQSRLQLPPDTGAGRNALQALGSALSYAKRYLTCDLFNIVTVGQDDDGNSMGYIDDRQAALLKRAVLTVGADEGKMLATYGAKALSEIPKSVYRAAQNLIEAKYRTKLQNEGADGQEIQERLAGLWK